MSLSTCEHCGGHIPLGPDATNRCEKCGRGVFSGPRFPCFEEAERHVIAPVHHAACEAYDGGACTCGLTGLQARVKELEEALRDIMREAHHPDYDGCYDIAHAALSGAKP
jgi:hypothetical protein